MGRIVVLPEELQVIVERLDKIENTMRREQGDIQDPIFDTEGIMKLLKISRRTLQNFRDNGLIEYSPVQGKFYYRLSAINKMLDKHLRKTDDCQ